MAIEPLFVPDRATLVKRLRLSCADEQDASGQGLIEEAMRRARVGLYDRLGSDLVAEILLTASVENPTTANQIRRSKSESAETLWVRKILICEMPLLFFDSRDDGQAIYNEEGFTRDAATNELEFLLDKVCAELEQILDELTCPEEDLGDAQVYLGEPDPPVKRPFGSVFP